MFHLRIDEHMKNELLKNAKVFKLLINRMIHFLRFSSLLNYFNHHILMITISAIVIEHQNHIFLLFNLSSNMVL